MKKWVLHIKYNMKQEYKELLLKDLCMRIPYGVKVQVFNYGIEAVETLYQIDLDGYISTIEGDELKYSYKPYLFPLSSMTEEQDKEFALLQTSAGKEGFLYAWNCATMMKWLLENHFDYNCLIEKGLAIDATNKKIY